jgi:hypothetical protein
MKKDAWYGVDSQFMKRNREKIRKLLRGKFAHDADCEEIVTRLLHGEGYERQFEEAAARAFKRKWMLEYVDKVERKWTVHRCAQAKQQAGCSGRGWDRQWATLRKSWNTETGEYDTLLVTTGVEGDEGVPLPRAIGEQTLAKERDEFATSIGIRCLVTDDSAVAMYSVRMAITRQCVEAGWDWCLGRVVEVLFSGDAHCSLKLKKMTHITLRCIGSTENDNSPDALWGLAHWQGGDDWAAMDAYCKDIQAAIEELKKEGCEIEVNFGKGKKMKVKLHLLMCADAAFLDSVNGGSGFTTVESCVICRCPKDKYGDSTHRIYPLKTEEYVNHSAHMPCRKANGKFNYKFNCPHGACGFKCNGLAEYTEEKKRMEGLSVTGVANFKSKHLGKMPLQHVLFRTDVQDRIPGTMHFTMNVVGHNWRHAIAFYIDSDELAIHVNDLLHTKCGVMIDLEKVSKGAHMDCAKLPKLPGPQAIKVAEYWDLFLDAAYFWKGRNTANQPIINKHKLASESMDALVAVWNEFLEPMDTDDRGLASQEVAEEKADIIEDLIHDWRDSYMAAYTNTACKPHTHMSLHFAPCQRRLQHGLTRYSCQAQEHYGKIAKFIIRCLFSFGGAILARLD